MSIKTLQNALIKKSVTYRGTVLHHCVMLEKTIDDYIAEYLTQDFPVQKRIYELLLDRMTFDGKKTAFKAILDSKEVLNGFKKTKNNSFPHAKLIEEIRELILERNCFAHYAVLTSQMALYKYPAEIGFIEFRDIANVKWYSDVKYKTLLKRIKDTTKKIERLIPK